VATNPLLVWYSQEARDYALLVLASSISLYFFAEALERPTVRVLALWAVSGFVAVAAHYFALFLLAGEAAILLSRVPRRRLLLVGAPFLVPTAALVPLVARQSALSKYPLALRTRLWELVRQLLVADYPAPHLQVVALLGLAAALVLFAVWPSGRERRGATFGIVLAASTVGIPILFALVGRDFVYYRNLIDVTLPFALFAGAVLGARRAGPAGLAVAAGVCALSVVVSTQIWRNESLHRDDWSAAVRSLGPPTSRRLVVTGPWDWFPLRLYRKNLRPLRATSADVDEIELIGVIVPSKLHPPAGFNLIEWRRAQRITVVRYRAARPQHVAPTDIRPRGTPWWHAGIFVDAP
jgi:hypothetical protein